MRRTIRKRLQAVAVLSLLGGAILLNSTPAVKGEEENLVDVYEDNYEHSTLESRCYLEQLNRIGLGKPVKLGYCDNKANLEKFRLEESDSILTRLGLTECRIVQSEEEHIRQGRGSVYATDIACIRGKTFDAKANAWGTISKIGEDSRLGNYVVLKQGKFEWVFGHTQTSLKVGDEINEGDVIGQINTSGMSQNYHLHFETWESGINTSSEGFKNDKSLKLKMQRGWLTKEDTDRQDTPGHTNENISADILHFIAKYEGKHLNAYWDARHYSIGYGTPSYKGETITSEEADRRAIERIERIRKAYNLYKYDKETQTALVSFAYNIGNIPTKILTLLDGGYNKAAGNEMKRYVFSNKKKLGGLVKRRNAEASLINK